MADQVRQNSLNKKSLNQSKTEYLPRQSQPCSPKIKVNSSKGSKKKKSTPKVHSKCGQNPQGRHSALINDPNLNSAQNSGKHPNTKRANRSPEISKFPDADRQSNSRGRRQTSFANQKAKSFTGVVGGGVQNTGKKTLQDEHSLGDGTTRKVSVNSSMEATQNTGDGDGQAPNEAKRKQKDSDNDDNSDYESMMRELDPEKRHIKQLKLKQKQLEQTRRKPLPRLSYEKRGWNAPLEEPYIPVGRMTEIVSSVEQVRSNLPHTRDRFMKQTYRQMLMVKKRERDLLDKQKKIRSQSRTTGRSVVGNSLSQSSLEEIKLEDPSRVIQSILPSEKSALLEIRNAAYDQRVQDIVAGKHVPSGPRLNKFGRIAAGYVAKLQEKRDLMEQFGKMPAGSQDSGSPSTSSLRQLQAAPSEPKVPKSHIEIQMEREKSHGWIRKRNGRIYDEKIKNLITTTDNGSSLLKHEIVESEGRLAAVKLGKSLQDVIPQNADEFFLTDKESYFLGDKRALRRQEKAQNPPRPKTQVKDQQEQQHTKTQADIPPTQFQTINSAHEYEPGGGFFLTEQPFAEGSGNSRQGIVRIPDLLDSIEAVNKQEETVNVKEMFQNAQDQNFERVFRATTDRVKGMFLDRVTSRQGRSYAAPKSQMQSRNPNAFRNQRAFSLSNSTAAQQVCNQSGPNLPLHKVVNHADQLASHNTSNFDTNRLTSANSEQHGVHNRRGSQPVTKKLVRTCPQDKNLYSVASQNTRNTTVVNATVSYEVSASLLNSNNDTVPNPRTGLVKTSLDASRCPNEDPKRLLKDARKKRSINFQSALSKDVDIKKNRVKYLQTLNMERMAKKKLDQAHGQKLFEGFSNEEMHEILVEMPQLKKMQKEMAKIIANGPAPPEFSNTQLIHLDSLHDIANRDKALLLKRVKEQINQRKQRIQSHVRENDEYYDLVDPAAPPVEKKIMSKANAAILKKFQQQTSDGHDDDIESNFDFHTTLKQRLNFADQKLQRQLYEAFKHEDFVHKIWDENGLDRSLQSERNYNTTAQSASDVANESNQLSRPTLATAQYCSTLRKTNRVSDGLNNTSNTSDLQPSLLGATTGSRRPLIGNQQTIDLTIQRQVEEELKEFDHSDQKILTKLIEVYEKRIEREALRIAEADTGKKLVNVNAPGETLSNAKGGTACPYDSKSRKNENKTQQKSIAVNGNLRKESSLKQASRASLTDNQSSRAMLAMSTYSLGTQSAAGNRPAASRQGSFNALNPERDSRQANHSHEGDIESNHLPPPPKLAKVKTLHPPQKPLMAQQHNRRTTMLIPPTKLGQRVTSSSELAIKHRPRKTNAGQLASVAAQSMHQREKKRAAVFRKEYRKQVVDHLMNEFKRAFEALVGAKETDLELVIHSLPMTAFHRETREFLVAKGQYMTDDHLIHLKEDPKTILNLYRIFMLKFKTSILGTIEKKQTCRRSGGSTGAKNNSAFNIYQGLPVNQIEGDESDYSESDFQDLLSNKQIEENIRVFFDRMHELVNPIDEQRLKLDSVQQIKSTVKTFYKRKADVAQTLLQELDQKRAERPVTVRVKRDQFNDPDRFDQSNLHTDMGRFVGVPQQQCGARMADIRLNAELFRLRRFKEVAEQTAQWYNQLAAMILAEHIQDDPLVLYMLDQIKNVIEIGEVFSRSHFRRLMATFDARDSKKNQVIKVRNFLEQLLPLEEEPVNRQCYEDINLTEFSPSVEQKSSLRERRTSGLNNGPTPRYANVSKELERHPLTNREVV